MLREHIVLLFRGTNFSSCVMTIGGITSIGAGRKNLVIAVSITAYNMVGKKESTLGKGRQCRILGKFDTGSSNYIHSITAVYARHTLLAATTDVPTTLPWSSTTSMPSLSS